MKFVDCKTLLSPNGTCNPYRGCTHGCIYCDSRFAEEDISAFLHPGQARQLTLF